MKPVQVTVLGFVPLLSGLYLSASTISINIFQILPISCSNYQFLSLSFKFCDLSTFCVNLCMQSHFLSHSQVVFCCNSPYGQKCGQKLIQRFRDFLAFSQEGWSCNFLRRVLVQTPHSAKNIPNKILHMIPQVSLQVAERGQIGCGGYDKRFERGFSQGQLAYSIFFSLLPLSRVQRLNFQPTTENV